jgi:hypothetical protein
MNLIIFNLYRLYFENNTNTGKKNSKKKYKQTNNKQTPLPPQKSNYQTDKRISHASCADEHVS